MEFEWKKFRGFTTLGILSEIQKMMAELECEPEQFQRRIIFMSMFNDITWRTPRNEENSAANSMNFATYAKGFHSDVGHIWDLVVRKSGMELTSTSQVVNGIELLRT